MTTKTKTEGTETVTTEGKEMATKLKAAGKKAEAQKAERRARTVKGSHLLEALETKAKSAGMNIEPQSGFLKVSAPNVKGRQIYIAKKGGKVNLAGFTVADKAIIQLTEEEARQKHLGKVRGTLDFNQTDEAVLHAYDKALKELSVAPAAAKAPATKE